MKKHDFDVPYGKNKYRLHDIYREFNINFFNGYSLLHTEKIVFSVRKGATRLTRLARSTIQKGGILANAGHMAFDSLMLLTVVSAVMKTAHIQSQQATAEFVLEFLTVGTAF